MKLRLTDPQKFGKKVLSASEVATTWAKVPENEHQLLTDWIQGGRASVAVKPSTQTLEDGE